MSAPCLACDGPIPPARGPDWCSRACRSALRALGSALEPAASRAEQLGAALAHRRTMRELGEPLSPTFHPDRYRGR